MTTFGKHFLIAVFTFAMMGFAQPLLTAETPAKTPDAAPAAPASLKVDAITDTKADVKQVIKDDTKAQEAPKDMQPDPGAIPKEEALAKAKADMEKALQKVDLTKLPKNITPYLADDNTTFVVAVGETKPIAAARNAKCLYKEAPAWENTAPRLPPSALVKFTDGGIYDRDSRRCGGPVPARAVFATGVKTGSERLVIFGYTITVLVR